LKESTLKTILTWDESGSSQRARSVGKMDQMLDARAAAFILQEYLDETQT
jgi:RNase H-fold protein (predicted Holliday junction resolvase)